MTAENMGSLEHALRSCEARRGRRLHRECPIRTRPAQAPQRCCDRWGKDGLLKAATGSGSLCALARFAQGGFSSVAQTR